MSKKPVDYSATLIYKITCKDPTVTDLYVGHTTNFVQRRDQHKQSSVNSDGKLYNFIRNNGGWANWTMEIIHFFNCKNLIEAKTKEQEYFISLKATLNSIEPMPSIKENVKTPKKVKVEIPEKVKVKISEKVNLNIRNFSCDKCNFTCDKQSDWKRHIVRPKHLRIIETTPKIIQKITCEKCEFECCNKRDWLRHISTPKHIKNIENKLEQKTIHKCKKCNNKYQYSSGLWKHSKTCNVENINHTTDVNKMDTSLSKDTDKNILESSIKDKEDFKTVVLDMFKNMCEIQKQILEILKNK